MYTMPKFGIGVFDSFPVWDSSVEFNHLNNMTTNSTQCTSSISYKLLWYSLISKGSNFRASDTNDILAISKQVFGQDKEYYACLYFISTTYKISMISEMFYQTI